MRNNNLINLAMTKSSNLVWTNAENWWLVKTSIIQRMNGLPSFQTEHDESVGFGEQVSSLYETNIKYLLFDIAKVSW